MTCRHYEGDPNCNSTTKEQKDIYHSILHAGGTEKEARVGAILWQKAEDLKKTSALLPQKLKRILEGDTTPDASKYIIQQAERVGPHLVLKLLYPNCSRCSYEGNKVLVMLNITEAQALKWRVIDPHFRAPDARTDECEAPSPAARFPASDEGWQDAINYARSKIRPLLPRP
jgi:hypothetical protein